MSIKSEILGIAAEHGYEGTAQTITGAINALTDTLAGEDVAGGRTVASAIHALSPYIGGGGGGEIGAPIAISTTAASSGTVPIASRVMACTGEGQSLTPLVCMAAYSGGSISDAWVPSGMTAMVYTSKTTAPSSVTLTDKDGVTSPIEHTFQVVGGNQSYVSVVLPYVDAEGATAEYGVPKTKLTIVF